MAKLLAENENGAWERRSTERPSRKARIAADGERATAHFHTNVLKPSLCRAAYPRGDGSNA
jgi:hypothetical protein